MTTIYSKKIICINACLEAAFRLVSFFFRRKKRILNDEFNILLIEPFQLGDMISLSTMFDPIKREYPKANIFILTKTSNKYLYKGDSRVKEVLVAEFPWSDHGAIRHGTIRRWLNLFAQLAKISKIKFEYGIDTRGDIRSQFILRVLKCQTIIGYNRNGGSNLTNFGLLLDISVVPSNIFVHRYEANVYILTALGLNIETLYPIKLPTLQVNTRETNHHILIHVGSGWEYKRWSESNWVYLINHILESYPIALHLIAGFGEKEVLEKLLEKLTPHNRLKSKITTYDELVEEIYNCKVFIGLDSGPMHIADCLNKPVLALFGPGNSELWRPYSTGSYYIHNIDDFKCNPCFQKKCLYPDNNCMDAIKLEEVIRLLRMFNI